MGYRASSTSALTKGRDTASLPGVEQDREPYQSHQDAEQNRELFQLHGWVECKKEARIAEASGAVSG
jgi:hypothetical protein